MSVQKKWDVRSRKSQVFCYLTMGMIMLILFIYWFLATMFDFVFIVGIRG